MLETPSIRWYSLDELRAVTIHPVRAISRKDRIGNIESSESSEAIRRPSLRKAIGEKMRWSDPCSDAGRRSNECPPNQRTTPALIGLQVTGLERNSLSGKFRPARMA